MSAEELWKLSGIKGTYEAWAFGEAQDKLAALMAAGVKTATSSSYILYEKEQEPLPEAGDYSVILNSRDEAVCIIKTVKVTVLPYDQVPAEFAYKEGEGDRSLNYWREVHEAFFANELAEAGLAFSEDMPVVCEEFEVVYAPETGQIR
ncbi:MAG: ASCH domain-containing protein [Lachnospiraceae bacterium]|nr:ASCH domain-containing protein [Lachnospiraceae bacterium]